MSGLRVIRTLADVPVGSAARIVEVDDACANGQRLCELGLTCGVACAVVRTAPMGDPIQIRVRGTSLALRRADAARVSVTVGA